MVYSSLQADGMATRVGRECVAKEKDTQRQTDITFSGVNTCFSRPSPLQLDLAGSQVFWSHVNLVPGTNQLKY